MKRIAFFLILIFCGTAHAYYTYIFRLSLVASDTESKVTYNFTGKGRVSDKQPFYGTYLLPGGTTEYQRLMITPKDDTEYSLVKSAFNTPGINLEIIYDLDQYGKPFIVEDHRKEFPDDFTYKQST